MYYGIDMSTGEIKSVEEVNRGFDCNCMCPSCGTRLEAHKGNKRAHHFQHDGNKECLYGAEISLYRAFYELLKKKKCFYIPDAILETDYGWKRKLVKQGSMLELTDVKFFNDSTNYPPELFCYVGEYYFRIILNIDSYYDDCDIKIMKHYGKKHKCPMISVNIYILERISDFAVLKEYIELPKRKKWIYNRLTDKAEQQYHSAQNEARRKQLSSQNDENLSDGSSLPTKNKDGIPIKYIDLVEQLENENYDQEDYLVYHRNVNLRYLKCVICNRVVCEQKIGKSETLNKGICMECMHLISNE